ncbi:WD40-like Beta Propeller Repeat [Pedococcus dokdonensis]|uniref:WD40-like Beta Propeller Repeat n=1 Tax=Pedococcus dokdonensis TaxID=443156 RepID=A0A1H0V6W3_9MICO|nr:PD40 domain-containing protein [Pedococcus dokdonensis]SDP73928.1 WD40-like Beta Propeller Repeat [Pedococcus dokdonensis]
MNQRARVAIFVAVVVLAVAGVFAYAVLRAQAPPPAPPAGAPSVPSASLAQVQGVPHLVYRSTALGPDFGKVAMSTLADPDGPRAVTTDACERVDQRGDTTLCLRSRPGVVLGSSVTAWDRSGRVTYRRNLPGIPSRARLSPDGRLAATTAFVTGDSYLSAGFATRTYLHDLTKGTAVHLEDFALTHQGRRITPVDRNYWGVTFVDDDTFYLTVAFDGTPWLAKGSLARRSVTTVRSGAECPSLSPDGTRVAYKRMQPSGGWRIAVLDLGAGREVLLTETRSVDDQVQWLDADTVLYGLPLTGARGGETDLYAVAADGVGRPRLLVPQAWSASVVR